MSSTLTAAGNYPLSLAGARTASVFGPGAGADGIDTRQPFEVLASVSAQGALTVELAQDGQIIQFFNASSASNPGAGLCERNVNGTRQCPEGVSAPSNVSYGLPTESSLRAATAWGRGMVMVVSLWGQPDLSRW